MRLARASTVPSLKGRHLEEAANQSPTDGAIGCGSVGWAGELGWGGRGLRWGKGRLMTDSPQQRLMFVATILSIPLLISNTDASHLSEAANDYGKG
jgi:hypothetical protein